MKKYPKIFVSLLCALLFLLPVFAGCAPEGGGDGDFVDYAGELKLDLGDPTSKKQKVTLRLLVDGDTTHFDPVDHKEDFAETQNYIKARYLGINTPESTGKIEKWGKTASLYVKSKLGDAVAIYVESNDTHWNVDSTGERYLLWIWYVPAGQDASDVNNYRNLNIELLQNGYGRGSGIPGSRYEEVATKALNQAQALKLHVFSAPSTVDENYFDDPAVHVSMQELRFHPEQYLDKNVRVEGTVIARFGSSAYIEDYDAEHNVSYGIGAFYGYNPDELLDILAIGNRVSVRGKVTAYQGVYQISDLSYDAFDPKNVNNTFRVEGETAETPFKVTKASDIVDGTGEVEVWLPVVGEDGETTDEKFTLDSREAIMSTSVTVENLKIKSMYTTNNGGKSDGAISITCEAEDGTEIVIRTEVLKKSDGKTLVTEADFEIGEHITVKGIVDKYTNNKGVTSYQVAIHRFDYFTFLDR